METHNKIRGNMNNEYDNELKFVEFYSNLINSYERRVQQCLKIIAILSVGLIITFVLLVLTQLNIIIGV